MNPHVLYRTRTFLAGLLLMACQVAWASQPIMDELVVTAAKSEQRIGDIAVAVSAVDDAELRLISHTHINESLQRVPGVWISRGNGQEHLTAIRSPVLTGAGGCGAFVMAQDGVSLRSPGFCNVNELFEATSETAKRIEVIRGPGSSIYGSNALHGVVNVLTPDVKAGKRTIGLEAGSWDYYRLKAGYSSDSFRADFSGTSDGGYKDESGFDQQKLILKHFHEGENRSITTTFSYTNLNQETAGFIQGFEAYKDTGSKKDNPNPEAYRDARSYRLVSTIDQQLGQGALTIKPYLRSVDMTFLQHFLPGQAIEENGHNSIGVMTLWHRDSWWRLGFELEYTDGFLEETQPNPTAGSAFLVETIPEGKHYDYDVTAVLAGAFAEFDVDVSDGLKLTGSIRYQHTNYDYDNRMLDGRTRDDGTSCGFGGCRFNRPADRDDTFNNWSPRMGFVYHLNDTQQFYGSLSRGFRAPQATELYRLQGGQNVADIDPVELDAVEVGLRGTTGTLNYSIALFAMEKDNFIFRDTARRNVDNGETSHEGVEFDVEWQITGNLASRFSFTWADHEYANDPALAATPLDGNTIDTAPETLGSASLSWTPVADHHLELEWVHIDEYYLDPQNLHKYDGHDLLHLRGNWQVSDQLDVGYRLMNLTDEDYAERADFGFGSYRYFVGTPRALFVGFTLDF